MQEGRNLQYISGSLHFRQASHMVVMCFWHWKRGFLFVLAVTAGHGQPSLGCGHWRSISNEHMDGFWLHQ